MADIPQTKTVKTIIQSVIANYKDLIHKMIPDEKKQHYTAQLDNILFSLPKDYIDRSIEMNSTEAGLLDNYLMHKLKSTGLLDEFINYAMRAIDQNLQNNPADAEKGLQLIKRERLINNTLHTPSTRIEELLKTYQEELEQKSSSTPTQSNSKPEPVSYDWLSKPDKELPELYQRLIANKLIHPDTIEEQLKAIFTAKPLQTIQPINWIGGKALLAYFLDCIQKHKIPTNTYVWSLALKCFINSKELQKSRSNYERINNNGKPKGYKIIDSILNDLQ